MAENSVIPMVSYEDAAAAIDWLVQAFGFTEKLRYTEDDGTVTHAELATDGGGLIMLATPTPDYVSPKRHRETCEQAPSGPRSPYVIDGVLVNVDDVDAHFARAKEAGARFSPSPRTSTSASGITGSRISRAIAGCSRRRSPWSHPRSGERSRPSVAQYRYVVADVFTDTPLQGNQVAVFTDAREIPEEQLQPIAREMNFSETVFVYKPEGEGHARIRIFTPTAEIPFAGHPTLGTAFVLAGPLQLGEIRLETGMGVVPVRLERDELRIVFGRMEQPLPTVEAYEGEAELLAALGVESSELPVEVYDNGLRHVYVTSGSEDAVAALRPDFSRLADLDGVLGINCIAGSGTHWKTRMFAPSGGVPEDPATGSAAGPLALHLARHGRIEFGDEIEISQGVEIGRPSTLFARVDGSADQVERVEVGGSAVIVSRGELKL